MDNEMNIYSSSTRMKKYCIEEEESVWLLVIKNSNILFSSASLIQDKQNTIEIKNMIIHNELMRNDSCSYEQNT